MVGDGDICAPDIKLPLAQAQHPAQHAARVDTCHQYLVNMLLRGCVKSEKYYIGEEAKFCDGD